MRWIILFILLSPVGLFFLATDNQASLESAPTYTPLQLASATRLVGQLDPSQLTIGERYYFELEQSDLQVLMSTQWGRQTFFQSWFQDTHIEADRVRHQFSGEFTLFGLTRYVNLDIYLIPDEPIASFQSIKVGALTLPNAANRWIEDWIWQQVQSGEFDITKLNPKTQITQQGNLLLSFDWLVI